jgi:hypothetical protein
MKKQISFKIIPLCLGVLAISFLLSYVVLAWTEPTMSPPGGNVAPPLRLIDGAASLTDATHSEGSVRDADQITGYNDLHLRATLDGTKASIYLDDDDKVLKFYTDNFERMQINASGNVGIGTTDPVEKLDVNGAIKFGTTASACDASHRGVMKYVPGGAGASDKLYMCMKDDDDVYDWILVKGAVAWLTDFTYRRPITLSSATSQADYQVLVTLTTAIMGSPYTNVNADGSDIRFTGSDEETLQDYWIESWSNTGTSKIWVKVKDSATLTIYMYYDKAAASSASSLANTMISGGSFADTFTDETKINAGDSSNYAVSGGEVRLRRWYETYGPDGTNDIVQIGSMYVARNTNTAGTANDGTKNWDTAISWAAGLNWLGKTDWRLPTGEIGGELSTIYDNKASLGSYTADWYWSSLESGAYAFRIYFGNGVWDYNGPKANNHYVRAVRSAGSSTYLSPGTLYSVTIPENSSQHVAVGTELSWSDTESGATDVKYQIEYYDGSWQLIPDADLSGNSAGFDTSPIDISSVKTDYGQIRLKAVLSTTNSSVTPSIQDWTVTYYYRKYASPEPLATVGSQEE